MEKKVPLFYRGMAVGAIHISYENNRLRLIGECPQTADGVLRAYACSSRDPSVRLLIGVMEPKDGVLRVAHTYTRNDLKMKKLSYDTIDTGELVRAVGASCAEGMLKWKSCTQPEKLFSDIALSRSLVGAQGVLCRDGDGEECIAVPFERESPFPLAPAFCLVQLVKLQGITYGVIGIDDERMPIRFNAR